MNHRVNSLKALKNTVSIIIGFYYLFLGILNQENIIAFPALFFLIYIFLLKLLDKNESKEV